MFSHLFQGIYKRVVRNAQQFDKFPFLKGFLSLHTFESYYNQIENKNEKECAVCQHLLQEFLDNRNFYSFDKSLTSFVREKVRHPVSSLDENQNLNVLLRINDYLHSHIQFAETNHYLDDSIDVVLPVPRDLRECFERIQPTLVSSTHTNYMGCLLLQNPSLILHLRHYLSDSSKLKASLNSLVLFPISYTQSIYQVAFLSDSQLPSSEGLSMKHKLIQYAYELRNERPSVQQTHSTDSTPSRKRKILNPDNETPREEEATSLEDYLSIDDTKKWNRVFNQLNCVHPILGETLFHPLVLFDPAQLNEHSLSSIHYVHRFEHVAVSREYEQIVKRLNETTGKSSSIPLCLACTTNYLSYPLLLDFASVFYNMGDRVHEAIQKKQLIAVNVKDVRDLLYNVTIDRRMIYPQILNRLGGEYARCANVIYKDLSSFN